MPDVWLGRFNRGLEKLFNIKGGPTIVDVNPSVSIVKTLDLAVEERYLQTWNRFASGVVTTAVAAQNGAVQLRNPVLSQAVAVIERLSFRVGPSTASSIIVSQQATNIDLTNPVTPQRLDNRTQSGSSMILTQTSNAVTGTTIISSAVTGSNEVSVIVTVNQELTLLPGTAVMVFDQTVNEVLVANFMWRERALESSELT